MPSARLIPSAVLLLCAFALAQELAKPTFEVASVKAAPTKQPVGAGPLGMNGGPGTASPDQIKCSWCTLEQLVETAYGLRRERVSGPEWLITERYDVVAKLPVGATQEQIAVMWQNLLTERFGLRFHWTPKEFETFELMIGKDGSKVKETAFDVSTIVRGGGNPQLDQNRRLIGPGMVNASWRTAEGLASRAMGNAQPLSRLVTVIANQTGRPVVDKTGLTGFYDFTVEFTPDPSTGPARRVVAAPVLRHLRNSHCWLQLNQAARRSRLPLKNN